MSKSKAGRREQGTHQEEQRGMNHQLAADDDAAALAAGHAAHMPVADDGVRRLRQAEVADDGVGHLLGRGRARLGAQPQARGVGDRLAHSERADEHLVLRHVRAAAVRQLRGVAVHLHAAVHRRPRRQPPGERVQQRAAGQWLASDAAVGPASARTRHEQARLADSPHRTLQGRAFCRSPTGRGWRTARPAARRPSRASGCRARGPWRRAR